MSGEIGVLLQFRNLIGVALPCLAKKDIACSPVLICMRIVWMGDPLDMNLASLIAMALFFFSSSLFSIIFLNWSNVIDLLGSSSCSYKSMV